MQIKIRTLTGRNRDVAVNDGDTVLKLKQELQEKEGISVDQIRLVYKGRPLDDSVTVSASGIQSGDIVNMVLTLRGGF